jgi:hypothetical protein
VRVVIRDFSADDEAVASTVGTIMALLVFLTFLSVIVNQYVPMWMRDSETSHMSSVLGQFGGVKGSIDLQMLAAQASLSSGTFQIPVTTATAVVLGVDGVPIFSTPTQGSLTMTPDTGPFTAVFYYTIKGAPVPQRVSEQTSGSIDLNVGNRYFTPQRIAYENGAVIRFQADGQFIRVRPTFSVLNTNNALNISFALQSLYGKGVITGTTTEMISTQLFAFDRQDYQTGRSNMNLNNSVLWINHTLTLYGKAWYQFFNQTLADSLKLGGTYAQTSLSETYAGKLGATTVYVVSWTLNPGTGLYTMRLQINGNNPGGMTIAAIHLLKGQIQVGIGDATTQVPV